MAISLVVPSVALTVASAKPIAADGLIVIDATSDVGESTVTELTVMPGMEIETVVNPCDQSVFRPVSATSIVCPCGRRLGAADSTDGSNVLSITLRMLD